MSGQIVLYDYLCEACNWNGEKYATYAERDSQLCPCCEYQGYLRRIVSAPHVYIAGKDRADATTADLLGIPEKELPSGLRTKK